MTDTDARPPGGAHPHAHLWDNGADPIAELRRLNTLRTKALSAFDEQVIPKGTPVAHLEQVLVPLYYSHRYQVEAVVKLIGGVDYAFQVRGDGQQGPTVVDFVTQRVAMLELMETLNPEFLAVEKRLLELIPPQPAGYPRHRELFPAYTGLTLDPMSLAESSVAHTFSLMMHPERLARVHLQHLYDAEQYSLTDYLYVIGQKINSLKATAASGRALIQLVERQYLLQLLALAGDRKIQPQVAAAALLAISNIDSQSRAVLDKPAPGDITAHHLYLVHLIREFQSKPGSFQLPEVKSMPPGAPIGCDFGPH